MQAADGNFYGTTQYGGVSDAGTIFELDASGTLTTLHSFTPGTDGTRPDSLLIQAIDGRFYGTTTGGGPNGGGVVYRLTLSPPAPTVTLSLSKTVISGCLTTTGRVTLISPAPAGGTIVTLSSDNLHASVPASVKVAEGKVTRSFSITTSPVAALETAIIEARVGSATGSSETLTLKPMAPMSVALSPNPVVGGSSVSGVVTLECAAGPGDIVVTLSSSKPAIASPAAPTVTVSFGARTAPFTVTTVPVGSTTKAAIKATANGVTKSKTLTVNFGS
jgi:uncharacterized repeat protein (TIGR03803 family)